MSISRVRRLSCVLLLLGVLGLPGTASADALTPGNLLVTRLTSGQLIEYTPAGVVVQTFTFQDFEGGNRDLRDAIVGPGGNVHAFNGTFTPRLSTLVPATGAFTHTPFDGWTTVNNLSYGGIGAIGDGVFVTDMETASTGAPFGVVRFSTSGGPTVRFGTRGYIDLTIGGDGLLYALASGGSMDVYDPADNSAVRTVTFASTIGSADIRGIAVAADGTIYAAGWNGSVYAASPTGSLLDSRSLDAAADLTDIDLNDLGQLMVTSRGTVFLTDTNLDSQTSFLIGNLVSLHGGFVTPLTVPEPSAAAGAALLAGVLLARRRRATPVQR